MENIAVWLALKTSVIIAHCTLYSCWKYSITLLKRSNKLSVILKIFHLCWYFWTMLQLSTLENIMSLTAEPSAAIYFRVRPLIAKLICFQLRCNLAVTNSLHTWTHTHCGIAFLFLRMRWNQSTFCSEQRGGLMRSTMSLRHVHTNIHPHIFTYRSLCTHPIWNLARPQHQQTLISEA